MAQKDPEQASWIERLFKVFGDAFTVDDDGRNAGAFRPRLNAISVVQEGSSQFGEGLVAERTPVIELNSSYGPSRLRDVVTEDNGGSVSISSEGEILLRTGTNAAGLARVEAAEIGRYIPGFAAEIGIGVRIPEASITNHGIRWGGLSPSRADGFYFKLNSAGLSVVRLRGGVEEAVPQANWNIDRLDGTGRSGVSINTAKGTLWQVDFTWYGYGAVTFGIIDVVDGSQRFIPCHRLSNFTETSVQTPNLRVFIEADNNGATTSVDANLGGRQYAIVGKYIPKFRFTGDARGPTSLSTTTQPLISFQRKAGFDDRSIKLGGYSIANSDNTPVRVEIRLDATLTGATFGSPTSYAADETALESDISAAAVTGGDVVWAGDVIGAGQQNSPSLSARDVNFDIPNGAVVTLCATAFSGTPSVVSGFHMREEW